MGFLGRGAQGTNGKKTNTAGGEIFFEKYECYSKKKHLFSKIKQQVSCAFVVGTNITTERPELRSSGGSEDGPESRRLCRCTRVSWKLQY